VHARPGVSVVAPRKPIALPSLWQQAHGGDV